MTARKIALGLKKGKKCAGGYIACCPAHDDNTPSLSIKAGADGTVLVHCFAGCTQEAVIAALKDLALWPEREQAHHNNDRRIIATYDYTDVDGNLFYQVLRTPGKDFPQRYPDGNGGWIWRKRRDRQVLYHLPELFEAPIVFVVEGEKDADTLRDYGFTATTAPGGSNAAWLPQFTEALRGREVIIVPDNDDAGREHASKVMRALKGNVHLILLQLEDESDPDTGETIRIKDITDWFTRHSEVELIAILDGQEVSPEKS